MFLYIFQFHHQSLRPQPQFKADSQQKVAKVRIAIGKKQSSADKGHRKGVRETLNV